MSTTLEEQVKAEEQRHANGNGAAPAPEELTLRGTEQLSFFNNGGKRPTSATLQLRSKTLDCERGTGFKKGTRVKIEAIFVVDGANDKDQIDKATGMVTDATLKSSAFMEDVRIVEVV